MKTTRAGSTGALIASLLALAACGGDAPSEGTATASAPAKVPASRGELWIVSADSPVEAQVLAYVHGLHAFVRNGDEVYSGTSRLKNVDHEGEALVIGLDGGLTARIEPSGDAEALVFSSGPRATLQHPTAEAAR